MIITSMHESYLQQRLHPATQLMQCVAFIVVVLGITHAGAGTDSSTGTDVLKVSLPFWEGCGLSGLTLQRMRPLCLTLDNHLTSSLPPS